MVCWGTARVGSRYRLEVTLSLFMLVVLFLIQQAQAEALIVEAEDVAKERAVVKPTNLKRKISIMSGTGFYVHKEGYIVTNEHVVRRCKQVSVKGPVNPTLAKVVGRDAEHDLALLKTDIPAPAVGILRRDNRYQKGQPVTVFGYPLDEGARGQYVMKSSEILDTTGPSGESNWVQFQDSVRQGNSGGPLLDSNGNVVGVVRGKARFYEFVVNTAGGVENEVRANNPVRTSDIAINLQSLKTFLAKNYVMFNETWHTNYQKPEAEIEQKAKDFVVNVNCVL